MRKRIIAVGVLAGGIALTGLAGSAYAAGASPATSSAPAAAKAKGPIAIVCVGGKAGGKTGAGKPGKVIIGGEAGKHVVKHETRVKLPGEPLGEPGKRVQLRKAPPGALVAKATTDGKGTVKIGPLPKGVHCSKVMPGTKGAPPLPPAR
jgi:hypothetical protein